MLRLLRVVAIVTTLLMLVGLPSSAVGHAPECASSGRLLRYVVLFDAGTPEQSARQAVHSACGTSTAYYPQIGVGVATSTEPGFAARFGFTRAYSAQAETVGTPAQAELASPVMPSTAARLPAAAQQLSADRSGEQWDMEMIHAPQARSINPGRPEVLVGVLDSGVDATHPDLAPAVDPTRSAGCLTGKPDRSPAAWTPSTSMHGTHVAGIIAAAQDGHGITGVAPGVRLASVKVVDDEGFIYPEYAVCGFMWAAQQHMRITNNSYSLDPWLLTCSNVPGQAVAYEAVRRAVEYATAHGVLSVAAAGNERTNLADPQQDVGSPDNAPNPRPRPVDSHCSVLPAGLAGVVAVSALGAQRVKSDYSSYGLGVITVTAPGGDRAQRSRRDSSGCVLSTVPGGYDYACGTSMAAPHVSGVAALLASARPESGPVELASLLRQQADPLPSPDHRGDPAAFYGAGLVDALRAVSARQD
ncbi:MAG TPA: S8 family serine peptidase [Pseudonocardiaceae bacterium]|nr:S8 family serine peptidase [Pseudonocardiaceae bacterium]